MVIGEERRAAASGALDEIAPPWEGRRAVAEKTVVLHGSPR